MTATQVPRDMDVETALRIVQAEFPDYAIRRLDWLQPKGEYTQPG